MLHFILNVNYLEPVPHQAELVDGSSPLSPNHADPAMRDGEECIELMAMSILNIPPRSASSRGVRFPAVHLAACCGKIFRSTDLMLQTNNEGM